MGTSAGTQLIDMEALAERVRFLRRRKRWKSQALADEAGLTTMTIHRIESGHKARLEIETVARLAQALNVSIDALVGRTDDITFPKREAYEQR